MRKLRTSGSVGGRAGNRSVYPTREKSCQSTILRTAEIHLRRFHRERSDQVSGNRILVLQQRQIARPVQAFHRSVLQTLDLPFVELSGQQNLFSSRHRLSSSSSTARLCNQVATDNLQKRNEIQPWMRLESPPRSVNWFMAFLAAGSNFQI